MDREVRQGPADQDCRPQRLRRTPARSVLDRSDRRRQRPADTVRVQDQRGGSPTETGVTRSSTVRPKPEPALAAAMRRAPLRTIDADGLGIGGEHLVRVRPEPHDHIHDLGHVLGHEIGMDGDQDGRQQFLGKHKAVADPRGRQEMMRLVDDEPVRPAGPGPQRRQLGGAQTAWRNACERWPKKTPWVNRFS